jgi:plastocyanin
MKKLTILSIIFISWFTIYSQTKHIISNTGLQFSPDEITVIIGDTIEFTLGSSHTVLEVSQETWNSNGSIALDGGFSAPTGSGEIVFDEVGTHYYICENHIMSGMKGKIIVEENTTTITSLSEEIYNITFYPNPVNSYGTIDFTIDKSQLISINLFNMLGSRVSELYNGSFPNGKYSLSVNFSDIPEGIYYLTIETPDLKKSIKIIK